MLKTPALPRAQSVDAPYFVDLINESRQRINQGNLCFDQSGQLTCHHRKLLDADAAKIKS